MAKSISINTPKKATKAAANSPKQAPEKRTNGRASDDKVENREQQSQDGTDVSPLEKFFLEALQGMYGAEKALLGALPAMQEAATTEDLQDAIEDHTLQTSKHVSRLEKIFKILGQPAEEKPCKVMEALIEEGVEVIASTPEKSMTRDAALIIAAQKVEHYEIAAYGGLVQLALTLGESDAADLLERTLEEEEDTDRLLTDIAEHSVNFEAEEETNEDIEDIVAEDVTTNEE